MASGVLAWWITDYSLSRVDVWGVDWLLRYTLASVVFTAFAAGGVANSINIIDGFNGLASTMSSLAFIGFGMIAWQVGDHALVGASIVLGACVWGFFWVNWPFGKLFLGDGGSYFIGFALAWVSVLLIERNPSVSAFAPLVICAHPITEVLFSIYRRHYKESNPGHPDRLHFHSLVKQRYARRWLGHLSNRVRNSITGVSVGLMTLVTVAFANMTYASSVGSGLVFILFVFVYVVVYIRMVRHYWPMRPLLFLGKP
jgi:UDP-N-acetylmuramyl pentapeptide phosphotransferase/UDP-N-acetylglucosamine-1-phosphate transferase